MTRVREGGERERAQPASGDGSAAHEIIENSKSQIMRRLAWQETSNNLCENLIFEKDNCLIGRKGMKLTAKLERWNWYTSLPQSSLQTEISKTSRAVCL